MRKKDNLNRFYIPIEPMSEKLMKSQNKSNRTLCNYLQTDCCDLDILDAYWQNTGHTSLSQLAAVLNWHASPT